MSGSTDRMTSTIACWRCSNGPNRHHRFQVITRIDTADRHPFGRWSGG
jgi:hypothetical protein